MVSTTYMDPHAVDQSVFAIPALALGMWSPSPVGAAKLSAQVQQGLGTLASEWQSFVGRRLQEDFDFVQRLSQARTPDQVRAAHA
jgi:hypothetical protein